MNTSETGNSLEELLSKFGSPEKIPAELLDSVGYARVEIEGGWRLARKENLKKAQEEEMSLEAKYERRPFSVIEFETAGKKVVNRQNSELFDEVQRRLRQHDRDEMLYPPAHPIHLLQEELAEYGRKDPGDGLDEVDRERIYDELDSWLVAKTYYP